MTVGFKSLAGDIYLCEPFTKRSPVLSVDLQNNYVKLFVPRESGGGGLETSL